MAATTTADEALPNSQNGFHATAARKLTPIQNFYSRKIIFITGGTGFLGKLLVEKLLWSCPDIGDIYLLVRGRNGKDVNTRLHEILESEAFYRVRKDIPGYRAKIKPVEGDCCQPGLGLSDQDRNILINEVNVVFHVAATVKFTEPLPFALAINVRATKEITEIAKQMKGLKSFVHVSTAFAKCNTTDLEERFYDGPMDPIKLLDFVEAADPAMVNAITPHLIGKWPNTYAFTKGLAEDYLRNHAVGMPLGVFRPSVVISSMYEPLPRWVDNWYGVNAFLTAFGTGVLRIMRVRGEAVANIIPADMCVNGLIAAAWGVAEHYKGLQIAERTSLNTPFYNYVLAPDNSLRWTDMYNITTRHSYTFPPSCAFWYRILFLEPNLMRYHVTKFFVHMVPAVLVDSLSWCVGKKRKFWRLYKRMDHMMDGIAFFVTQTWNFSNHNMPKLIDKMTQEDRKLYFCDMRQINWDEYFSTYFLGLRRYLLREDDSTIPAARKRYARLYILHQVSRLVMYLLVLCGLIKTGKFFRRIISA